MTDVTSVRKTLFSPEKGEKKKKKKKKDIIGIDNSGMSVARSEKEHLDPPPKKVIPIGGKNIDNEKEKIDPPTLEDEISEMETFVDNLDKSPAEGKKIPEQFSNSTGPKREGG